MISTVTYFRYDEQCAFPNAFGDSLMYLLVSRICLSQVLLCIASTLVGCVLRFVSQG